MLRMTAETSGQPQPNEERKRWYERHPAWAWTAVIAGAALFIAALIWGPWIVEGQHLKEGGKLVSSAGIIVTGFRTMLVAIAAFIFTALGLWYTHQNHQHTVKKDREQADLTREEQVTGRYVEAVKLLASDRLHERLGGIYSLERIMNDSAKDRATVIEVLAAFARSTQLAAPATTLPANAKAVHWTEADNLQTLHEDVRAALNVLGRNWTEDRPRADLRRINVSGIDMSEVNLAGADLSFATLSQAYLSDAVLNNAVLNWAELNVANLNSATLNGAQLEGADLRGADLYTAQLNGARLIQAHLGDANLIRAELNAATLNWAELAGARLEGVQLIGATLNDADLRATELHQARDLLVDQVVVAYITSSTLLPDDIADDDGIKARIAQCEAAHAAGEVPPPWTGEGSTPD